MNPSPSVHAKVSAIDGTDGELIRFQSAADALVRNA
ncbi:hypothetical protein EC40522_2881, partial [Escherichia coli 4.0522]